MKNSIVAVLLSFFFFVSFAWAEPVALDVVKTHTHKTHSTKQDRQSTEVVDLNTADQSALTTIKGIGPKKAQIIIDYRKQNGPFKEVRDLANVKGFGAKTLERILKNNHDRLVVK